MYQPSTHRSLQISLAAGLIFCLGGFSQGSCFGPTQEDDACLRDADCGEGSFCDSSVTVPEPVDQAQKGGSMPLMHACQPLPDSCLLNEDCPGGFVCDFGEQWGEGSSGGRAGGEPAPDPRGCIAPPPGQCVPAPTECQSDTDCAPDEFCNQPIYATDCACPMGVPCDCGTGSAGPGVCEPRPTGCQSDADCAPDEACLMPEIACDCAPYGDCYCPPGEGVCNPRPDPSQCDVDADCGPGAHCNLMEAVCPAGPDGSPPDCFMQVGFCEPDPQVNCSADSDCQPTERCVPRLVDCVCGPGEPCDCDIPLGICESVPPQTCDTVSCGAGQHCELQEVWCFTDPCPPLPICVPDDLCFGSWLDQAGSCVGPDDGPLPPECCPAPPPPTLCPGEGDPRVSYICTGSECWAMGAWICPDTQRLFSNSCGGGCIDLDACAGQDELSCQDDALCTPIYAGGACDPSRVCTPDSGYQGCAATL